jgi:16S rRNA (guanine527-N7)-methyltransferase
MTAGAPGAARAQLLEVLERSRAAGHLGPGPVDRQLAHSAALARLLAPFAGNFLDLGAGGGLPGLALVQAWPESTAVFVDAQIRRCSFLEEAVRDLGLESRVTVRCGRAERLARDPDLRGQFALVVARGFGPPPVTAECAVGFLEVGGRLAVTEPPPEQGSLDQTRWPAEGLAQLGLSLDEVRRGAKVGAAILELRSELMDRWPRRDGVPGKRPLW